MQDQKISKETAKLAQSKGFDLKEPCDCGGYRKCICEAAHSRIPDYVYRPTQALLQRWLREKHGLEVNIKSDMLGFGVYVVEREILKGKTVKPSNIFQTYEEALETGLKFALEEMIKK